MKRIPQGKYTKEFREEAVKLVTEQGLSVPESSRRLDIPKSTINNWVRASKTGKLSNIGKKQRELSDIELELAEVKRELARVKMERDILKKPRCISRRSRCEIRHGRRTSAPLSCKGPLQAAKFIGKRLIQLADSSIFPAKGG